MFNKGTEISILFDLYGLKFHAWTQCFHLCLLDSEIIHVTVAGYISTTIVSSNT